MYIKLKNVINTKGFSLIELMVVVAIIGILAAIGIPQYSKFQAKTRQSEAKGALATLYTNEASFMGEWNQYTTDLRNIGFGVSGTRLRYVVGFVTALGAPNRACTGYVTTNGAPTETQNITNNLSCGANVNTATTSQATFATATGLTVAANQCTAVAAATVITTSTGATATAINCVASAGSQDYTAGAFGDPNANVGVNFVDGWTINARKSLGNPSPGIL